MSSALTLPDYPVLIQLLIGFAMMLLAGDLLVRGALAFGNKLNLSPLMAGLFIVGIGTSLPELLVSLNAAATGSPGLAVGNIVGSNIANVFLVLALPALILPFKAGGPGQKSAWLFLALAVAAWIAITAVRPLTPLVGVCLLLMFVGYCGVTLLGAAKAEAAGIDHGIRPAEKKGMHWLLGMMFVPIGITGLFIASSLIISGGTGVARDLNIPQEYIGLTVLAVGTSLPEIGASIASALRRKGELMVGNITGASIFNILASGGAVSMFGPLQVAPTFHQYDHWAMALAALVLGALIFTKARVGRLTAILLLLVYAVYIYGLITGINLLGLLQPAAA